MKANSLINFIEKSPSAFHVIKNIENELIDNGFKQLLEFQNWELEENGKYFVTKNNSSIIAFVVNSKNYNAFNIVSSHSDSPTFKIKENAEITVNESYLKLNTEPYGGAILSTWMDRPLSIAGRVFVNENGQTVQKLLNIDRDLLVIPNLAIHMDRTVNESKNFNPQIDTLPLLSGSVDKGQLLTTICDELNIKQTDFLASDLYLYSRAKGTTVGLNNEFIVSPKLDDLECVYSSLQGFLKSNHNNISTIPVYAVFDNEEVGSSSKQGALSTFMADVFKRINISLGHNEEHFFTSLAQSFMLSADNAHGLHPNYTTHSDPTNAPILNKGIVIKHNANQAYTTDGVSNALLKTLLKNKNIPFQSFTNRSNIKGGSTLGNLLNHSISINTVDIGAAQLAMHSSCETAGTKDLEYMYQTFIEFYSTSFGEQVIQSILYRQ